ncbi:hypothetical protein D6C78_09634 [Aureobasidium pullulans]|uniref:Uncharacterized protein n=1 Tax=Aureobasidium pullulans TaxID=5580 RepID=A0A4T0BEV4_AURPU|nr:hypothetical protein D6C78_09634 [Aureobasidium pullulans]
MTSTVNFSDLYSYDQRHSDSLHQMMLWGNPQSFYPQYSLPIPDSMLDQYSCAPNLYSQSTFQNLPINQYSYQSPYHHAYHSLFNAGQRGVQGSTWPLSYGVDLNTGLTTDLTSYQMPGTHGQVEDQAAPVSDSTDSSGSPQQHRLMEVGSTRTASPAAVKTAEDPITYLCDAVCQTQERGSQNALVSSLKNKPSSMKVSLRFVIESPVGQEADRETSREVRPDGPAQQPWEQAGGIVHEDPDQLPEDPLTIRVLRNE